jgi:hypothetical protein
VFPEAMLKSRTDGLRFMVTVEVPLTMATSVFVPLGTAAGFQLPAVFQFPLPGIFHAVWPQSTEPGMETRSHVKSKLTLADWHKASKGQAGRKSEIELGTSRTIEGRAENVDRWCSLRAVSERS